MIKALKEFAVLRDAINEDLEPYIRNEEIDLEERWKAYLEACNIGLITEYNNYYYKCDHIIDFDYFDELYSERHETSTFCEFIEQLLDSELITEEQEKLIKADVLKKYFNQIGFTYDW